MATKPDQAPASPNPLDQDDLTGVYGFFRKHQKTLLYTAGLFTLLTFSITGPMMSLVGEMFGDRAPMPTIVVQGKRVSLTPMDVQYGSLIAHNGRALPRGVMPAIGVGDGGENELGEVLSILRRAAIEEGLGISMAEVDLAIEAEREASKAESASRLARDRSFGSLAQYRDAVGEAMRIGTYVQLQMLALDVSPSRVLAQLLDGREKITLSVATFDEKAHEEQLKTSGVTDEELRTWLDAKGDMEKRQIQAFDVPRTELRLTALLTAPDQFDPEQWKDDVLKDYTVNDAQLQSYYDQDKDLRFKLESGEGHKPFADEAVQAELTRVLQAEQVMNHLLSKVRTQQIEQMKPLTDALNEAQSALGLAERALSDLEERKVTKQQELEVKKQALTESPGNLELAAQVSELEAEIKRLTDEAFAATDVVPAKKAAVTAAEQALKDARAAFDMTAALAPHLEGKKGFVTHALEGLRTADEYKDLDALGTGLGTWPQSMQGTRAQNVGDMAFGPTRASKGVLLFQASKADPRPLKPWDQLKPLVEGAYWAEKAKAVGVEKRTAMEVALLEQAKQRMADFMSGLESRRQERIDTALAEWQTQVEASIAEAEGVLARQGLGTQARAAWQRKLDSKRTELAAKDQKRDEIGASVQKAIDAEIRAEAKKHYGDVLAAAAAQVGFTVSSHGPFPRDITQLPRFKYDYDPAVVFVMTSNGKLKVGEATDVLYDATGRRSVVAVCTAVEPMAPADVTRREFELLRTGYGYTDFATIQTMGALQHAFTLDAVQKRYGYERAVGEQTEPTARQ
jgi:hypothetical protein